MKSNTLKRAAFVIAALVIAGVTIGLALFYKPHKDFGASSPDITLTAPQLVQRFAIDEQLATKELVAGDKTVLVTGTVREKEDNADGSVTIVLAAGADASVSCTLRPDQTRMAEAVSIGAPVAIQGQCTGMQELIEQQVIMIRCVLAE
jgi:hypothetical protein